MVVVERVQCRTHLYCCWIRASVSKINAKMTQPITKHNWSQFYIELRVLPGVTLMMVSNIYLNVPVCGASLQWNILTLPTPKCSKIFLLVLPDFDGFSTPSTAQRTEHVAMSTKSIKLHPAAFVGFSTPQYSPANRACSNVYQIHQTPPGCFCWIQDCGIAKPRMLCICYCTNSTSLTIIGPGTFLLHVDGFWMVPSKTALGVRVNEFLLFSCSQHNEFNWNPYTDRNLHVQKCSQKCTPILFQLNILKGGYIFGTTLLRVCLLYLNQDMVTIISFYKSENAFLKNLWMFVAEVENSVTKLFNQL